RSSVASDKSTDDGAVRLDRQVSSLKEKTDGDGKWSVPRTETPAARIDLRCWQDGAQIIHEKRLAAAVEPFGYVLKLPARVEAGSPVYLSAWANTTCLIKPAD